MKAADAALIALLAAQRQYHMWEIYTITLANGNVIVWISGDPPLL